MFRSLTATRTWLEVTGSRKGQQGVKQRGSGWELLVTYLGTEPYCSTETWGSRKEGFFSLLSAAQ